MNSLLKKNHIRALTVPLIILLTMMAGIVTFSSPVWAENTGGDEHDSTGGGGDSTNSGGSCPNNSCGSVIYSGATGIVAIPVTEQTKNEGIHVPSVCTNSGCTSFNYTPSESTIKTGDAAIGSTYYLAAMYADADGVVYVDGVAKEVKKGDVITYIPFESNGSNGLSSLWSIANSRREYGDISFSEAMTLYHQMLAYLNRELSLSELIAFGGLLKEIGIPPEDICEIGLCDDPTPGPIPPLTSCHIGSHVGWTEGKAQVINMTTGTGWTGEVWARPGDTVRFKIDYCWGAQAVGGSNGNPSSPWAINNEGITQSNGDSFYPSRGGGVNIGRQWFQISASKGNGYLFGENEQYIGSSNHILTQPHNDTIGAATENQVPNEYVDSTGDYSFIVLSPSSKAVDADRYNCSIFDFGAFTITDGHGYQIPGVGTGGCAAISGNGGNMNDAGSSFSQTITYDNITAWQQWGHKESGKGCNGCCPYNEGSRVPDCPLEENGVRNDLTIQNNNRFSDPYASADASKGAGTWGLYEKNGAKESTAEFKYQCEKKACSTEYWSQPWLGCTPGNTYCPTGYYDRPEEGRWGICDGGEETNPPSNASGTNTTHSKPSGCSRSCNCDGNCTDGCWTAHPAYNFSKPTFNYTTSAANLGTTSSTATVNVPYSYRTSLTSAIQEGDVIYLGETVFSAFTASIIPRVVTNVRPGEAYATVVPGYIRAVEFVVDANSNLSPATGSSNAGGSDPCSYYSSLGMISGCNTIWEEHGAGGYLNEEGRYGGKTYSTSVNRVVPDVYPVGSKYCVAVGISTSDSHNQPDTQVVGGMSSPSGWRISNLSCRTIAKKPNFQVWNGTFYTKGSIKTSTTIKRVGANLGDSTDPTGYFGSWEEYIISAKGNVTGMSSAAGLGYYGGYNNRMLGLQGGTSPGKSFCELSRMTIANDDCASEAGGKYYAGNSMIEDSAATLIERIRSRYLSAIHGINQLDNGATYIYPDQANISTSELYRISHGVLDNTQLSDSVIRQTKSAINAKSEQTTRNYASNALIIHVDGTLTIDTDICTGNGTCGSNPNLVLTQRNSDYYTNIYSLPQVLIIADGGIVIKDNVTQIDAWLITNGNINTCNGLTYNSNDFSANACANQLIINGPIFANSLTPVRNSGANGGIGSGNPAGGNPITFNLTDDGSIQPAEIINLRPDVLFWAYSQAQRFSQANVTYTRELAPRY